MSLEYEALSDLSPIVVDIETAPLAHARDFLDPPDLEHITAPSNYTKSDTIAAYIDREREKRLADFERDCTSKAALDFNLARIVALGWWTETGGVEHRLCQTEVDESAALTHFWAVSRQRQIVGFCIRTFDLPMMIQRSRYLGVPYPTLELGRYARGQVVIDLFDVLTFGDLRAESIMSRSVHSFCRRFGLPITDTVKGKDIPALVANGAWDLVTQHVTSDVALECALARQVGVIQPAPMSAGAR